MSSNNTGFHGEIKKDILLISCLSGAMNYQLKTITKYTSNFGEVNVTSAPQKSNVYFW